MTSTDGVTWANRSSGIYEQLYGVAYGNSTFVAVGSLGTILQSGALAPAMRPELGPIVLLPSGSVQVMVTGLVAQIYSLQTSSNLTDWLTFTNFTLSSPYEQFVDPSGGNLPRRFYRVTGQ